MSASKDDELAMLRHQRKLEIQKQMEAQATKQVEAEFAEQQKQIESSAIDSAMKKLLTPDARSRLATISMATPERSDQIKKGIIHLYESKSFTPPMSDGQLKQLLLSQSKSRHSASIRRI